MALAAKLLVLALLAQVVLTLGVGLAMGRARFAAGRRGEFTLADIAVRGENYPEHQRKFSNNFANQFETPVLFYALGLLALVLGAANGFAAALAWFYVATRVGHAVEHVGQNRVMRRFRWFAAGVLLLAGLLLVDVVALARA